LDRTETPALAINERELVAGTRVGLHVIARKLGQGGMGAVYLASDPILHKNVAIKVLSADIVGASSAQRFLNEAKATVAVDHPNIVSVFHFGQLHDGRLYYVMEYLPGRTLGGRLADQDLDGPELRRLLLQICGALAAAHARGIVHRDLKPENISIVEPEFAPSAVKILDFGLVKMEGSEKLTRTGTLMGSPPYMAPEQCSGTAVGAAVDLYAFGVILYEVFAGRLPFTGDFIRAHLVNTPPPPSQFAELPAALERLILDCLEKDPGRRPGSAAEVSRRLEEALGPEGLRPAARGGGRPARSTTATAPTGVAPAPAAPAHTLAPLVATLPPARSSRSYLVGVLGVVALAGGGLWYAESRTARPAQPASPSPHTPAASAGPPPTPAPASAPVRPAPEPHPAPEKKTRLARVPRDRASATAPSTAPPVAASPVVPPPAAAGAPDADDVLIRTYPR
jgi:hypothetical protein